MILQFHLALRRGCTQKLALYEFTTFYSKWDSNSNLFI